MNSHHGIVKVDRLGNTQYFSEAHGLASLTRTPSSQPLPYAISFTQQYLYNQDFIRVGIAMSTIAMKYSQVSSDAVKINQEITRLVDEASSVFQESAVQIQDSASQILQKLHPILKQDYCEASIAIAVSIPAETSEVSLEIGNIGEGLLVIVNGKKLKIREMIYPKILTVEEKNYQDSTKGLFRVNSDDIIFHMSEQAWKKFPYKLENDSYIIDKDSIDAILTQDQDPKHFSPAKFMHQLNQFFQNSHEQMNSYAVSVMCVPNPTVELVRILIEDPKNSFTVLMRLSNNPEFYGEEQLFVLNRLRSEFKIISPGCVPENFSEQYVPFYSPDQIQLLKEVLGFLPYLDALFNEGVSSALAKQFVELAIQIMQCKSDVRKQDSILRGFTLYEFSDCDRYFAFQALTMIFPHLKAVPFFDRPICRDTILKDAILKSESSRSNQESKDGMSQKFVKDNYFLKVMDADSSAYIFGSTAITKISVPVVMNMEIQLKFLMKNGIKNGVSLFINNKKQKAKFKLSIKSGIVKVNENIHSSSYAIVILDSVTFKIRTVFAKAKRYFISNQESIKENDFVILLDAGALAHCYFQAQIIHNALIPGLKNASAFAVGSAVLRSFMINQMCAEDKLQAFPSGNVAMGVMRVPEEAVELVRYLIENDKDRLAVINRLISLKVDQSRMQAIIKRLQEDKYIPRKDNEVFEFNEDLAVKVYHENLVDLIPGLLIISKFCLQKENIGKQDFIVSELNHITSLKERNVAYLLMLDVLKADKNSVRDSKFFVSYTHSFSKAQSIICYDALVLIKTVLPNFFIRQDKLEYLNRAREMAIFTKQERLSGSKSGNVSAIQQINIWIEDLNQGNAISQLKYASLSPSRTSGVIPEVKENVLTLGEGDNDDDKGLKI